MPVKAAASPAVKRSKYRAIRTEVDGVVFHSKAEASRYGYLKALEQAGEIVSLYIQPSYDLIVEGVKVGRYVADFSYTRANGEIVIEDVKGMKTPVYRLKKKIVEACHGIQITEIQ